jgi:hypothetical protein
MWSLLVSMVLGVGKGPEPARPPSPYIGAEAGDGLVLLSDLGPWAELHDRAEGEDEVTSVEGNRRWLGPKADLMVVDPGRGVIVDAAPHAEVVARVGERFEVVGAGRRCEVEVVSGDRAILWFTHQLVEMDYPGKEPLSVTYRGPGLRGRTQRPVDASTEVITTATLERDMNYSPVRWRALRVKAVRGMCPIDGLAASLSGSVGETGRLVEVVGADGDKTLAHALRPEFRKNKWIAKITGEYRAELASHGPAGVGCQQDARKKAPPGQLDEGHFGLRTRVFESEGGSMLALAHVGDPRSLCDPSNAAIVYRKDGAKWRQVRELWGGPVRPVRPEVVVKDLGSGRVWLAAWRIGPMYAQGWNLVVTGLDKPGTGVRWGGLPEADGDLCRYDNSPWELSSMCVFEETSETE